eukprot:GHVT01104951.1.p1 GENE.GHVT01104951.1~~GHVT01104951.1.p1  ORF type:complete len:309 (-),score=28.67 GHVT01104951.1:2016-2942(-)
MAAAGACVRFQSSFEQRPVKLCVRPLPAGHGRPHPTGHDVSFFLPATCAAAALLALAVRSKKTLAIHGPVKNHNRRRELPPVGIVAAPHATPQPESTALVKIPLPVRLDPLTPTPKQQVDTNAIRRTMNGYISQCFAVDSVQGGGPFSPSFTARRLLPKSSALRATIGCSGVVLILFYFSMMCWYSSEWCLYFNHRQVPGMVVAIPFGLVTCILAFGLGWELHTVCTKRYDAHQNDKLLTTCREKNFLQRTPLMEDLTGIGKGNGNGIEARTETQINSSNETLHSLVESPTVQIQTTSADGTFLETQL